jgi:hypothetical protein
MNDKEYREQKERIRKLVKKWCRTLGLRWWTIDFIYHRDRKDPNEKSVYSPIALQGMWETAFSVHSDAYYLTASVDCYLPILAQITDDKLEPMFLHEMMHIFLSRLHSKKKDEEEELVATQLANAILWSREAGQHDRTTHQLPLSKKARKPSKKKSSTGSGGKTKARGKVGRPRSSKKHV